MGININSLSPTQAREYWYDYNNGNHKGTSDAEYAMLCTKFKPYLAAWESDETVYRTSPEDRLNFDEDDAGFFGSDGQGIENTIYTAGNLALGTFGKKLATDLALDAAKKTAKEAVQKAAVEAGKKAAEEAAKKGAKEAAQKVVQDATQKAAQNAAKTASEKAIQKAGEETAKKAAEEAAKTAAEEAVKDTVEESTKNIVEDAAQKAAEESANKFQTVESGLLLVMAALHLASAIKVTKDSPNEDAVKACAEAENELYNEQAILANEVANMEDAQIEMDVLQQQALVTNEKGQDKIVSIESYYNYLNDRVKNGTATEYEVSLLNALGLQMQKTQSSTLTETKALNSEIADVGEVYEVASASIENSTAFTDYVAQIDEATRTNSYIQAGLMAVSMAGATLTASKCVIRANALGWNPFSGIAAAMYVAAAVMSGVAAGMFGVEAYKQLVTNVNVANKTIDARSNTQEMVSETTDFQAVSMEYWQEAVDTTSEDNLFTYVPTYAVQNAATTTAQGTETETSTTDVEDTEVAATTNNYTFGGVTGGANQDDEKDEKKQK